MIGQYIFRIHRYYSKKGLLNTTAHLFKIVNRTLFQNAFILFYADLNQLNNYTYQYTGGYSVVCIQNGKEMTSKDLHKLIEKRGDVITKAQIANRFSKGALLWLIRQREEVLGFVWTICKTTVRPYFFPLTDKDVHFFDNEIFIDYRGKGINSILINHVLVELAKKDFARAYIETKLWNEPEIRSLRKTSFRQFAKASKFSICGKGITRWS